MTLILPRRSFLIGLATLIAAPAVVRADALMPIRVWKPTWRNKSYVTFDCLEEEFATTNFASLKLPIWEFNHLPHGTVQCYGHY